MECHPGPEMLHVIYQPLYLTFGCELDDTEGALLTPLSPSFSNEEEGGEVRFWSIIENCVDELLENESIAIWPGIVGEIQVGERACIMPRVAYFRTWTLYFPFWRFMYFSSAAVSSAPRDIP